MGMKTCFLWPIERIDANGEPDPAGGMIKIGLRAEGSKRAVWVDLLDAEALADGIRALIAGRKVEDPITACTYCTDCRAGIELGEACYQKTPGGLDAMLCEECAPTVEEESHGLVAELEAGEIPKGFKSRSEVISWRAFARLGYPGHAKRLTPLVTLAPDLALEFPEPPARARPGEDWKGPEDDRHE